jgi:AcrR family transcriptional regulator
VAPKTASADDTRGRILEAALRLFSELGYDKTSLREIAEEVNVTKAALYYYFRSKEDILAALAGSLFETLDDVLPAFEKMDAEGFNLRVWGGAVDVLIANMLEHRKVFALLERNRAVFEQLHDKSHQFGQHAAVHEMVDRVLADPDISVRDRIRFVCSIGAISGVVMGMTAGFDDFDAGELMEPLTDAIHDLLGDR